VPPSSRPPLREIVLLFLRLGLTAFGGPIAHVALIERECVQRRGWMTREHFVDLLGASNLIPGPTSTELVMHVGYARGGWGGLIAAGLAFILPSALLVFGLATVYVEAGELTLTRYVFAAVQPVVLVVVLDAILPLARTAYRSTAAVVIGLMAAAAVLAGMAEIAVLLLAGALHVALRWRSPPAVALGVAAAVLLSPSLSALATSAPPVPSLAEIFGYFFRTGALLFGSGYVLVPVLEGDLVAGRGWLSARQLLDAVAAGQATPGPVFTTATFVGRVVGGPAGAVAATVGIFLPAFIGSAVSVVVLDRLRGSAVARRFLDGVNAAAVALIGVVLVSLGGAALTSPIAVGIAGAAVFLRFYVRLDAGLLLAGAAIGGAVAALRL
jgi:chromate transporter